jgi:ferredoxin
MVTINHQACKGCGLCVESCPTCALQLVDGVAQIDEDLCQGCEICIDVCPQGAISSMEIVEKTYPVVLEANPLSVSVWGKENALDHAATILPTQHSTETLARPRKSLGEWLGSAFVFLVHDLTPAVENLLRLKRQYKADTTLTQPHIVDSTMGKDPSGQRGGRRVRRRRRRRRQ